MEPFISKSMLMLFELNGAIAGPMLKWLERITGAGIQLLGSFSNIQEQPQMVTFM